jgi:SAM-dependent methyltransferase
MVARTATGEGKLNSQFSLNNLAEIMRTDPMTLYCSELDRIISGCESLLDVGCGADSPVQHLQHRAAHQVGVDGFRRSIDASREKHIHDDYRCIDILHIGQAFARDSFDCVLASDVIEHLDKDDGYRLVEQMESIARKKSIIFTPNGFLAQGEHSDNPLQRHRSGWTVAEMWQLGYDVIGINGWKPLLGELAAVRYRPRKLWSLISRVTQLYVRDRPQHAFQILCVKELQSGEAT